MLLSGVPPPQSPATAGLRPPGPPTGHSTGTADADRTDVAGNGQVRQSFAATLDRVAQPRALARSPDAAGRTPFDHRLAGFEPELTAEFDALAILTPTAGMPTPRDALRGVPTDVSVARDDASGRLDAGMDAQSGDRRRQMSEGMFQQWVQQHGAGARLANTMAQFTLAAGPAAGEPAAQPLPTENLAGSAVTTGATIGTGTGLNPFSGQPPLSPLGDQGRWSQSLGERVLMMSDGGVQTARIRLQPEHLGTLDVRIHIEDDTARVFFSAPYGQTREALEAALPKLREMFEANGMHLVQADVSADRQRQDADDDPWTRRVDGAASSTDAELAAELAAAPRPLAVSDRLVRNIVPGAVACHEILLMGPREQVQIADLVKQAHREGFIGAHAFDMPGYAGTDRGDAVRLFPDALELRQDRLQPFLLFHLLYREGRCGTAYHVEAELCDRRAWLANLAINAAKCRRVSQLDQSCGQRRLRVDQCYDVLNGLAAVAEQPVKLNDDRGKAR